MGIYGHQTAYILHLSTHWVISSTLNLVSILEYFPQEASDFNSRTSYFQEEEIDVGQLLRELLPAKTILVLLRHLLMYGSLLILEYLKNSSFSLE